MTKADERNEGHHGTCAQPRNVRCAAAQVCGALAAHGDLALCIELQTFSEFPSLMNRMNTCQGKPGKRNCAS